VSRDEVIAANPIVEFVRNRGHDLVRAGENFVTSGCPVAQHKRGHRPVIVYPQTESWSCHDCKRGGSVIDWLMHEKNITAADAMRRLAGSGNDGASQIVAAYDYTDETGKLLFQCVRYQPKAFKQRRKAKPSDPPEKIREGWVWNLKGVRRVLYRLPEVIKAQIVMVAEGEKDADNLTKLGFTATTNPMGAEKWRDEYSETLRGRDVVVFGDVGDEDGAGERHTAQRIQSLNGVAKSIKRVELPVFIASGERDRKHPQIDRRNAGN
jgi:DNA primase